MTKSDPERPEPNETPFGRSLSEYRKFLQDLEQKSQDSYYRTVLALSGGALGISFAFVKDVVPFSTAVHKGWLHLAWFSWGASLGIVLIGLYLNVLAFGRAINQLDEKQIYLHHPGGVLDVLSQIWDFISGVLFLGGLVSIFVFVYMNL